MIVCALVLGFFCECSAQTETKNLFQTEWNRENDRIFSKNIVNDSIIGDAQLRLWLSPKNIVYFTVMTPCLLNKRLVQVVTWKEGDELAFGESCTGRPMQTDLPKYIESYFHPLPPMIERARKKIVL